jgi:hypothetical protein
MQNRGFRQMGEDDISVLIVEVLDLVLLKTAGSAKVNVAGIIVAKDTLFNFCSLPSIDRFVRDLLAESGFCKEAEAMLQGGEVSELFEPVQEGDDGAAVKKVNGREFAIPNPSSNN